MRRITIALLVTALSALGAASSAGAATGGTFTLDVTSAKVGIGPVPSIPIDPSAVDQKITLAGTVGADGKLTVAKKDVTLPTVTLPIPQEVITTLVGALASGGGSGLDLGSLLGGLLGGGAGTTPAAATRSHPRAVTRATPGFDLSSIAGLISDVSVTAGLTATGPATGTFDSSTGATTLNLGAGLGLGLSATVFLPIKNLVSCGITPLNFALTTGTAVVPGKGTTLTGSAYNPATGAVTLVGAADSPAPACAFNPLVKGLLSGVGGGAFDLDALTANIPALGAATVELTGKMAFKRDAVDPPPVTTTTTSTTTITPPPPDVVAAAVLKISKTIKVAGKTVTIRISCSHKDCNGTVRLRGTTSSASSAKLRTLGSKSYRVRAGKTVGVKVPLSSSARSWLKRKKHAKATVVVSAAGGTGAQKNVTLTR